MPLESLIRLQNKFKERDVTPLVILYLQEKQKLTQYKQSSDMAIYKVNKYLSNKYQK